MNKPPNTPLIVCMNGHYISTPLTLPADAYLLEGAQYQWVIAPDFNLVTAVSPDEVDAVMED